MLTATPCPACHSADCTADACLDEAREQLFDAADLALADLTRVTIDHDAVVARLGSWRADGVVSALRAQGYRVELDDVGIDWWVIRVSPAAEERAA